MHDVNHIIEKAVNLNHTVEVLSDIKSGKEAVVYRATLDGDLVAMKVYKKLEERNFKNTGVYSLGKYYRRPSERRSATKNSTFIKKLRHENWVKREFFVLKKLFDSGASIPQPILQIDDAIFMELLGNKSMVAPRLCDVELEKNEAKKAFDEVLRNVEIFWNAGIVHADLSEFNILWWKSHPHIIDFPQSIDCRTHPNPKEFLDRDLRNIVKYFGKYIDIDLDEMESRFQYEMPFL